MVCWPGLVGWLIRTRLACGRCVRPSVRPSHRTAVAPRTPRSRISAKTKNKIHILIQILFRNILIIKTERKIGGNNPISRHPTNRSMSYTKARQNANLFLTGGRSDLQSWGRTTINSGFYWIEQQSNPRPWWHIQVWRPHGFSEEWSGEPGGWRSISHPKSKKLDAVLVGESFH